MGGTSLALERRRRDPRFAEEYFAGAGIDVGAGPDSLAAQLRDFPQITSCRSWDKADGDAHDMAGIEVGSLDFVYSSHCLEHLERPFEALLRWFELLRPGGHLVVVVPEWELYERHRWPSVHNADHKFAWSIVAKGPERVVRSVLAACVLLEDECGETVKIERLDHGYRADLPDVDQTATGSCECGIEFIVRKTT